MARALGETFGETLGETLGDRFLLAVPVGDRLTGGGDCFPAGDPFFFVLLAAVGELFFAPPPAVSADAVAVLVGRGRLFFEDEPGLLFGDFVEPLGDFLSFFDDEPGLLFGDLFLLRWMDCSMAWLARSSSSGSDSEAIAPSLLVAV